MSSLISFFTVIVFIGWMKRHYLHRQEYFDFFASLCVSQRILDLPSTCSCKFIVLDEDRDRLNVVVAISVFMKR